MKELLYTLKKQNIDIEVVNGQLKIQVPETFSDSSLLQKLKLHKEDLISYIENAKAKKMFSGIKPADKAPLYPASYAQRRFYFLYELDKNSIEYNMPQVFKINQKPDLVKMKDAFVKLVDRHEILRTTFVFKNENLFQKINTEIKASLSEINLKSEGIKENIRKLITPFNLENGPLIRMFVIETDDKEWFLVADLHHIVADGVSLGLLVKDFFDFYNGNTVTPLKLQYKDYSVWQQSEPQLKKQETKAAFWRKMFENECALPQLPFDLDNRDENIAGRTQLMFSENDTKKVFKAIEQEKVTPFIYFLSALQILTGKIANQQDVVIGVPVAGRDHNDLEELIGIFINTLPVRCYPEGSQKFNAFLSKVKSTFLDCLDNQSYPFEELIKELNLSRQGTDNPLYSVILSYEDFEPAFESKPNMLMEPVDIGLKSAKAPLSFTINSSNGRLKVTLDYNAARFSGEMAERVLNCFTNVINQITQKSDVLISEIKLLNAHEQFSANREFQENVANYATDKGIIDCFEEQVKKYPDRVAVAFENKDISYGELSGKVNHLAAQFIERGIKKGHNIAILIDHSPELILAMLATMKCGATFVPIDVNWPKNRINASLELVEPSLILTSNDESMLSQSEKTIEIHYDGVKEAEALSMVSTRGNDDLYIIFTSGSTGKPKGVAVPSKGVMNRLYWMNEFFGKETSSSVLQTTRYVYDSVIWQFFWPLINGGKTVIMPGNFKHTANEICDLIEKHGVRLVDFVPSVFNTVFENSGTKEDPFKERLKSLRYIIQGGEEISEINTRKFLSNYPEIKIINLYGPTEASIGCIFHEVEKDGKGKIPIGKPIKNVSYYILDQNGYPLPDGIAGELCLSGVCLASGYFNMPDLTAEKFIYNQNVNKRIYKTGDLVKRNRNGNIEFLGRIDQQVKIRGYRIELPEIENTMKSFPYFNDVAVKLQEEGNQKWLVAYYVAQNNIEKNVIQDFLKDTLPSYMIPDFFLRLERLPLLANGKLDRKSLPPANSIEETEIVLPETETEAKMVEVWSEVLGIDTNRISIDANFFAIGGHSLAAISLSNKIQRTFDIKVSIKDIFNNNTIRSMASFVDSSAWLTGDSLEVNISETNLVI